VESLIGDWDSIVRFHSLSLDRAKKRGECLWKRKAKTAEIKKKIGVFLPAPWLWSGRNMRGLILKMSLVTTEEQAKLAEVARMKNRVRYNL